MRRSNMIYLAQEAVLILVLSYVLWLGGTYNGIIFYRFRLVSWVMLVVVGVIWLAWRWRLRGGGPELFRVPLLLLLLAYGLACITSSDPRRSSIILWQIGLAVWIFWLVCDLLAAGWPAELWVKSLLVAGSIAIILAVLVIIRWYQSWLDIGGLEQLAPPVILRVWTLPGHPNFVAGTMNLLWPLALARMAGRRSWPKRVIFAVWVLAAWFVLLFTSSRGGWLGAAAALGTLLVLWAIDQGGWSRLGALAQAVRSRPGFTLPIVLLVVIIAGGLMVVAVAQLGHPSHIPALMSRDKFWSPAWRAFVEHPWTGIGPLTFVGEYSQDRSIPPHNIFTHAHSIPLNVLAETGLFGLLALLAVVVAVVRRSVRVWRSAEVGQRFELMGSLAALVGAAVHGLFDTVQMMPTLAMLLVIVGAIGLYGQPVAGFRKTKRWAAPILWGLLAGTGLWSLWGYAPASEGVLAANLGDWEWAAPALETAAERDSSLGINQFHLGYTYGVLAVDDPSRLEPAIAHYQSGLEHDQSYAPHHANLAALLWAAGHHEEAISEMKQAEEWAPYSWIFPLNLGVYFEELGELDAATVAYLRALELMEPEPSYFWASTPARAEALAIALSDPTAQQDDGWSAYLSGDYSGARDVFEKALVKQPNSVAVRRGLAAVALAEGKQDAAEYHLRVALFIGSTYDPSEYVEVQMEWARLMAVEGKYQLAVDQAMPVLDAYRRQNFFGPGRYGTADYGWYVFYRESFLEDMLPQLVTIGLPDKVGGWMLEVAGWQRQVGEDEAARALCQEVLAAIPDNSAAMECIDALAE